MKEAIVHYPDANGYYSRCGISNRWFSLTLKRCWAHVNCQRCHHTRSGQAWAMVARLKQQVREQRLSEAPREDV